MASKSRSLAAGSPRSQSLCVCSCQRPESSVLLLPSMQSSRDSLQAEYTRAAIATSLCARRRRKWPPPLHPSFHPNSRDLSLALAEPADGCELPLSIRIGDVVIIMLHRANRCPACCISFTRSLYILRSSTQWPARCSRHQSACQQVRTCLQSRHTTPCTTSQSRRR